MNTFAQVDSKNTVINIVIADHFSNLQNIEANTWIEVTSNTIAYIGGTYDSSNNIFIPLKQYDSWVFDYSLKKYPDAKVFGITTGLAVMKINSDLGYKPVPFSELTTDPSFWKGCQTCTNYDILKSKDNKMCLCTGMLYDPKEKQKIPSCY